MSLTGQGMFVAAVEFASANLITNVAATGATVTGNQMTGAIHEDLAGKNLAPGRHYPDSGYLSAAVVVPALTTWGIALTGPLLADTSAQARAGHGYARADFTIDYDTRAVTCPQGKTSTSWTPCTQHGKDAIVATFSAGDCGPCPARSLCTTGRRRQLTVLPRDLARAQAAARAAEKTTGSHADYARRAGVEGTMHQTASHCARRARYRGTPKTCACRESRPWLWPAGLLSLPSRRDDHRSCACGSCSS